MKKLEMLQKAVYYYNMADKEQQENGDTNKRRDLIAQMIGYINIYELNGGKRLQNDNYKPLKYLQKEYNEELIFTPTKEDLNEIKYWYY